MIFSAHEMLDIRRKAGLFFLSLSIVLFQLFGPAPAAKAGELKDGIPYKLALIHVRNLDLEKSFLDNKLEPPNATIAEFQWIMATLKGRCLNPETAIADTILETWQTAKNNRLGLSLLEVARVLTMVARNTVLFGHEKVNFRMTTKYWLSQNIPQKN